MKKVVVLAAAIALLATPAFANIRNSKHDLSSSSTASVKSDNVNESCVFCHTPHGGTTGMLAPLWNRATIAGGFATTDLYNSATLQNSARPTQVVAAVNNSDAPLCYSCHDGSSLAGGLNNPPASNGNNQPTFSGASVVAGDANLNGSAEALTNDHPIGMNYSQVIADGDGGLNASTGSYPNEVVDTLPLYTNNGVMWCSTCHDVHNQGGGQPFLNKSNSGSALCTTCHIK